MLKATVFSSMSSACHPICGLQDPFDFRSVKRRKRPGDTSQQTTVGWHNHTLCAHENQTSAEALGSDFEIRTAPSPFFFPHYVIQQRPPALVKYLRASFWGHLLLLIMQASKHIELQYYYSYHFFFSLFPAARDPYKIDI